MSRATFVRHMVRLLLSNEGHYDIVDADLAGSTKLADSRRPSH